MGILGGKNVAPEGGHVSQRLEHQTEWESVDGSRAQGMVEPRAKEVR